MKKLVILLMIMYSSFAFSQLDWNTLGNTPVPGNFLGTNNNQPLRIRTNSIERFKIMPGGNGSTDGQVAMGNNLPPLFIPQARLHLYQDAPSAIYTKYTAGNTGTNLTDGFDVGYDATSAIQNRQYAEMHNRENTAMKFWTNNTQRMHINQSRQSQVATGIGGTNIYNIFTPGYVGIGRNNPGNNWGTQPL